MTMSLSKIFTKQEYVLAGAGLLCVWQLAFLCGYLPSPGAVWLIFVQLFCQGDSVYQLNLPGLVASSMKVQLLGSAIAFLLAIPLGILLGYYRSLERFFEIYMELLRPIPPLAWIPVGYILFKSFAGPTFYVQLLVVFMGAFFPALTSTMHGVRSTDPILIEAAAALGAKKDRQILLKVVFPGALPAIISGVKSGLGVAWMCIVAAEFVGGRMGIGAYIWGLYNLGGRMTEIVIAILTVGVVGCIMNQGVNYLGRRVAPWHWW